MAILVVERGNDKGKSMKLEPGRGYVFGRDPESSAIPLNDSLTSRRHFQIRVEATSATIRDLSSTNGTFLNDEAIQVAELRVGDKIQVGETILSYLSDKREETAHGLVGKVLGGYKILERVGRGGMGTVFKANQLSLNRIVAFKVLSSRLLKDPKFIERFQSEARAAGQMNHANIVQVYDVANDRAIHFFSMEFMDGGSLQDRIGKDGKLPWAEVLDVLSQAAAALIFAEKSGIVHRDVKPDNLMLTSDGQVKLADLGLARRRDQAKVGAEEGIFGTPHFISPEQARGLEIDHRADLYSLGATAFRLLAGRTPFKGRNVKEIITQQITTAPPPLRKLCPECPDELLAVVEKLMRKDPDERYPSASALREDLENIRLEYQIKARGRGAGRGVFVAVGLAVAAVVAVVVFAMSRGKTKATPLPQNGGIASITTRPPDHPPDRPPIDPDADLQSREKAAGLDCREIQLDEKPLGRIADTWESQKAEWKDVARRYLAVADKYPDTDACKVARKRAEAITADLLRLANEKAARLKAALKSWTAYRTKVENALVEGRYAEALHLAEQARDDETLKESFDLVPAARTAISGWVAKTTVPDSIRNRFGKALARVLREVEDLRSRGEYANAVARGRAFLATAAGDVTRSPFGPARANFDALVAEMRDELKKRLEAQVKADNALLYSTYLSIRHADDPSLPTPEVPFPDNPVFEYRFEEAARRLSRILTGQPALASAPYRERVTRKVAQLESVGTLLDALVARLQSGDLLSDELNLPAALKGGQDVRKIEIDRSATPVASREGISVSKEIRVGGTVAKAREFLRWERFSPSELWTRVFLSGKRWAMSPQESACAAFFLAECGLADGLAEMIEAAGASLDTAARRHLDGELRAIRAWNAVRVICDTKPPEDRYTAFATFVTRYRTSDCFVLVYGFDKAGVHLLLPDKILEAWMDASLKPLEGK